MALIVQGGLGTIMNGAEMPLEGLQPQRSVSENLSWVLGSDPSTAPRSLCDSGTRLDLSVLLFPLSLKRA